MKRFRFVIAAAALLPTLAFAHPGHGEASGFADGALHPLSGFDHLAGLIIVGILLSRLGGRYVAPLAAVLLGFLVAAGTSDSEGWRFAAGFALTGYFLEHDVLAPHGLAVPQARERLIAFLARSSKIPA